MKKQIACISCIFFLGLASAVYAQESSQVEETTVNQTEADALSETSAVAGSETASSSSKDDISEETPGFIKRTVNFATSLPLGYDFGCEPTLHGSLTYLNVKYKWSEEKQTFARILFNYGSTLSLEPSSKYEVSDIAVVKKYEDEEKAIDFEYLYLKNSIFKNTDAIKQIRIYPPEKERCEVIVIYEVPDVLPLPDNGRYLSIDPGLHNLMTCYDCASGDTFIIGRKYLPLCRYFNKEIARVQSQWSSAQYRQGIRYPKNSKHLQKLYKKKNHSVNDYLHKVTRHIVRYCGEHGINTVVIGDITNIRQGKDLGHKTNQKLHALPYAKICRMLEYKLAMCGIRFVKQDEAYTSQTSPLSEKVSRENARKRNRVKRGLYEDRGYVWNADSVGAFNILRLYVSSKGKEIRPDPNEIRPPYVVKVAV